MRIIYFVATAVLLAGAINARAENGIAEGPNGLRIRCSDFTKLPDGRWRSSPEATLNYPDNPGLFGSNTFREGVVNMSGTDVAKFLDEKCPK